ncbi:Vegetative incompatibility protein HET-E-1 [Cytospora mali]|uniref:Vegetative incompatibility protein HET-E-1 n=1 Tax=Cytospora mali TaxID=578113 RepID=A0A194VVT3_CYTMA|nr:Vegetative incompatibility protein HET-E-1 [Valsa mali]
MRLLEVDTLRFKVIHDPRQPIRVGGSVDRYAILSHTWDDGQELSYQDWQVWQQKGPGYQEMERRSGFHKIMDTCRKAKEMGYSLVWIDTICIDKSSSAELSEAINSMFAFYTHASVCLALLSDVENADGDEGFMNSRWFTRGWTLQELLAPDDVRFFDRGWLELGSKLSLEHRHLISRVTSIPEIFLLKNAPLSLASVAERLSWAARRNTTRTEDSSYCLLGIFDITMPLLYDASLEETSPQQQETFKGALFFLRKTNVKITRLVQVLVGIRETAMGSTKLQLSICRKTIAGGGNAEANEISALCAKLEGKTPDANDIQRCFWTKDPDCEHKPSTDHTSDVQPDNVLVHAWHRTYNAAISRPIKELTHTADLEEEKGIKPLHVFIWEEMGSRSLKRETSDLGREELNADI